MRGYLIDYSGTEYLLPELIRFNCSYGYGTPCDAFEICCVYSPEMAGILPGSFRFRAIHDGETQFFGVVDEYRITLDERGSLLHISGRGMAALLLDNESEALEYTTCTWADIAANHIEPTGITKIRADAMGTLNRFTVESGTSQWNVLCRFATFAGQLTPRFSKDGTLVVSGQAGSSISITEKTGCWDVEFSERRYGVISEVLVKNKAAKTSELVVNESFSARGGKCRRVINVPRKTGYDAMRYTGMYQIEKSEEESRVLTCTVPALFCAFPGDTAEISLGKKFGFSGSYKVWETEVWADKTGSGTTLHMVPLG